DSDADGYETSECEKEKACKFDLASQTKEYCPCSESGDDERGSCKICIGDVNNDDSDCICPTNSSQVIGDLPSRCKSFCVKGSSTEDCICDTVVESYKASECEKEKACMFKLVDQNTSLCPCRETGDPRDSSICEYCIKGSATSSCICNTGLGSSYSVEQCKQEKAFLNLQNCKYDDNLTLIQFGCKCVKGYSPIGCTCPISGLDLTGISPQACPCRLTGDIRAGSTCKVTEDCESGILEPSNRGCFCTDNYQKTGCACTSTYSQEGCVCDLLSTTYNPTTCLATKLCTGGDFINPTPTGCTPLHCTSKSQTFKCNCVEGKDPIGCTCPISAQDLTGISNESCPCLPTGDIRAGTTCPSYCTGPDQPNTNCICDTNINGQYPLLDCQQSKENKDQKGISFATFADMQSEAGTADTLHRSLSIDALTSTFIASQCVVLMSPNMYKIAEERLPAVFHIFARAVAGQTQTIYGDHSDVMAARQTEWVLLNSATVQEVHDLDIVDQMHSSFHIALDYTLDQQNRSCFDLTSRDCLETGLFILDLMGL
ncbi:MAG: Pyruvate-ferrodoxin oxidoreductase, partial [Streblomastix strix]